MQRALLLPLLLMIMNCSSTIPNQAPMGKTFPTTRGNSLDGKAYLLPEDFSGKPVVLLIGYTQRSQFDLDRWILGLLQLESPVRLVELPTIDGMFPGLFANRIDESMRRGIPEEDWGTVITIYDDAAPVLTFTGNENPNRGRVLLLNEKGIVVWFSDRGYSASQVKDLDTKVRAIRDNE